MRTSQTLRDLGFGLLGLLLLLAVPLAGGDGAVRDFIIYVMAYGLLAMSLNLLIGYAGLVSFGHAAFFGSGAYIFGLLLQTGSVSLPLAFAGAVVGTALLALVIGVLCIRLREIYFAFLTLAFQMLLHSIVLTSVSITGGDQGLLGGIPRPPFLGIDLGNPATFYATTCCVFVAALLLMRQILQSSFGYTLRLIRDNADRAAFLGVDVPAAKLLAFVLAGSFAAIGGVIMALFVSSAYPEFLFWTTSGDAIFMVMLGGLHVFLGPLVGAVLLQALNHFATAWFSTHGLVLGVVILLFTLGLRRGLLDWLVDWRAGGRRTAISAAASQKDGTGS